MEFRPENKGEIIAKRQEHELAKHQVKLMRIRVDRDSLNDSPLAQRLRKLRRLEIK